MRESSHLSHSLPPLQLHHHSLGPDLADTYQGSLQCVSGSLLQIRPPQSHAPLQAELSGQTKVCSKSTTIRAFNSHAPQDEVSPTTSTGPLKVHPRSPLWPLLLPWPPFPGQSKPFHRAWNICVCSSPILCLEGTPLLQCLPKVSSLCLREQSLPFVLSREERGTLSLAPGDQPAKPRLGELLRDKSQASPRSKLQRKYTGKEGKPRDQRVSDS